MQAEDAVVNNVRMRMRTLQVRNNEKSTRDLGYEVGYPDRHVKTKEVDAVCDEEQTSNLIFGSRGRLQSNSAMSMRLTVFAPSVKGNWNPLLRTSRGKDSMTCSECRWTCNRCN